jgi:uncharacterized protein YndB with AHSA1/START domain
MLDAVTREIVVPASPAEAWVAVTNPVQVAEWFGDSAQIDLRVGGSVRFTWPAGEVSHGVVVAVEPVTRFAFRWDVFGTIADPTRFTEVDFRIRAVDGGTAIRVTERGLQALAQADVAPYLDDLVEEHIDGWRNEMSDLAEWLGSGSRAAHAARAGLGAPLRRSLG